MAHFSREERRKKTGDAFNVTTKTLIIRQRLKQKRRQKLINGKEKYHFYISFFFHEHDVWSRFGVAVER